MKYINYYIYRTCSYGCLSLLYMHTTVQTVTVCHWYAGGFAMPDMQCYNLTCWMTYLAWYGMVWCGVVWQCMFIVGS